MPRQLTQSLIEEWVSITKGQFSLRDIWNEIGIESSEGKKHLRTILDRLEEKGIITHLEKGYGNYRRVDNEATKMDWENADPDNTVPLLFPFGEHEFVKIFPKSIIIVAGSKQAGKTEYLYNFIKLNMAKYPIDLFNSETGPEQMKERFVSLGITPSPTFNVYERYDNFADVINSDHISVIDYLDLNSEVYLVGSEIDAIFRKLRSVAIIALQKPPPAVTYIKGVKKVIERDLAYGGGFTAKRAILYITMGQSSLKLLYVKSPAQKKINPQNMTFTFNFSEEGHFANIQRSYGHLGEGK